MKTYANNGKPSSEITTRITSDGKVITSTTVWNSTTGRISSQHISIRKPDGTVSDIDSIGGRILPE